MDALVAIASVAAILTLFGVVAAIVGEDTRDGFREDPHTSSLMLGTRHR